MSNDTSIWFREGLCALSTARTANSSGVWIIHAQRQLLLKAGSCVIGFSMEGEKIASIMTDGPGPSGFRKEVLLLW